MNIKLFRPEVFQGSLNKKNYFEGWYFKHVSRDLNYVWSFIPGISLNDKDPHSFIQVINGVTGATEYIKYPLDKFSWDTDNLYIKIGDSIFTDKFIDLNIEDTLVKVRGHFDYSGVTRFPRGFLSPGIMGWYSYIPFMECKHGVVSVNHSISGKIILNNEKISFDGGKGYIEKDWGSSFPEAWLWIQANNFSDWNSSFHFSVAKIPWRGKFFIGFIAFLYFNKRYLLFSTYNNSVIREMNHSGDSIDLVLKNRENILKIRAYKSTFGELKAPVLGDMSRKIKESIDSEVYLSLYDKQNNLIYCDSSKRAGLEVIEKIFEYVK